MPETPAETSEIKDDQQKTCFVIMPISDPEGYEKCHFQRVYDHLICPACLKAGFQPNRADEVSQSNMIVIDILRRIVESEMVLCDMSAKNPNVFFELGVRQAFNKPSFLIKDNITDRVFDTDSLRTKQYDVSLRVDTVQRDMPRISEGLVKTYEHVGKDFNSLIQLLQIEPAKIGERTTFSIETSIIISEMRKLSRRLSSIESNVSTQKSKANVTVGELLKRYGTPSMIYETSTEAGILLGDEQIAFVGDKIFDKKNGKFLGELIDFDKNSVLIRTGEESDSAMLMDMSVAKNLTTIGTITSET